jgi:pilus assembly protein Flp/PilA
MKALVKRTKEFLASEAGPTATEYAVMLALIIIVAIIAIQALGTTVKSMFQSLADELGQVDVDAGLGGA